jgi:hypothetical protein
VGAGAGVRSAEGALPPPPHAAKKVATAAISKLFRTVRMCVICASSADNRVDPRVTND